MDNNPQPALPLPDKKIPSAVMIIGTFEISVALLGLIILVLIGQFNANTVALLTLLAIYGALGAGLWAIQEWARFVNIVLHVLTIPYILITLPFWESQSLWQPTAQFIIALYIIIALTRPTMRHKFQTVVPKQKDH